MIVTTIRAVYWDLGGVILRTFDRSRRAAWERRLGLPEGQLDAAVFGCEASRKATIGQSGSEAIWQEVEARFRLTADESRGLARDFFAGDRLDQPLLDLIRQLRPFFRIGMITNAWPNIREILENRLGISDDFDSVTTSAEVGFAKPNPHIYRLALQSLAVAPEESVFIDDFEENVQGARALGMLAIHFRNPEQAIGELSSCLALGSDDEAGPRGRLSRQPA